MNSPDTQNDTSELDAREQVFSGKTLRENLRDIVARNNTGYKYDELIQAVADGEDGLEDDEIEAVDKTVNLLAHLFSYELAQREQAAELRGRIDELGKTTEIWIHNQHEDDFSDYLQRRKATLQATKPEKGTEE